MAMESFSEERPRSHEKKIFVDALGREQHEVTYTLLEDEKTRERLLVRMDALIDEVQSRNTDAVVFLDRSARPLSWLMKERFRMRFPDQQVPEMKFMNIHPEKAPHTRGSIHEMDLDKSATSDEWLEIDDIPKATQKFYVKSEAPAVRALQRRLGPQLAGKHVLVIDELVTSGHTLTASMVLLRAAIPEIAGVAGKPFFTQQVDCDLYPTKCIPWYTEKAAPGIMESKNVAGFSVPVNSAGLDAWHETELAKDIKREGASFPDFYADEADEIFATLPVLTEAYASHYGAMSADEQSTHLSPDEFDALRAVMYATFQDMSAAADVPSRRRAYDAMVSFHTAALSAFKGYFERDEPLDQDVERALQAVIRGTLATMRAVWSPPVARAEVPLAREDAETVFRAQGTQLRAELRQLAHEHLPS